MNNNLVKILLSLVFVYLTTMLDASAQVYYVYGDERLEEEKALSDSILQNPILDSAEVFAKIDECIVFCLNSGDLIKATGSLAHLSVLCNQVNCVSGQFRSLQRLERIAEKYNLPGAYLQSKLLYANFVFLDTLAERNIDKRMKNALNLYFDAQSYLEQRNDPKLMCQLYLQMGIFFGTAGDYNYSKRYLLKSIDIVDYQIKDADLQSEVYYRAALVYMETEDYEPAKIYVKLAIDICERMDYPQRALKCHLVFGDYYAKNSKPNYSLAYGEYDKVINLARERNIDNPYILAKAYNGMGIIFCRQDNYEEGLPLMRKSLEMRKKLNNLVDLAESYLSFAYYYKGMKNFDSARVYFEDAFNAALKRRYQKQIVASSLELASIWSHQGNYEKAYKYEKIAFLGYSVLSDAQNNKALLTAEMENSMERERQRTAQSLHDSEEAARQSRIAAQLSYVVAILAVISVIVVVVLLRKKRRKNQQLREQKEELNQQKEELKQQSETLARQNAELEKLSLVARQTDNSIFLTDPDGNIIWLNEAFTRHSGYNIDDYLDAHSNSIIKASSNNEIAEVMERIRHTKQPETYTSKTHNKAGKEIWIQTTLSPSLDSEGNIAMFIAVCSDITDLKHAQEKIAVQNKEINESLEYARKIQEDIQAPKLFVDYVLGDYFVVNFPKNIVSGDFHWVAFKDNKTLFSLADCTGHGIPGGFMSMIEQVMLNNVLHEVEEVTSANILNKLRERNIRLLHQRGRSIDSQDGMDASLFVFDRDAMVLNYAAGYSIAYLLRFGVPDDDTIRRAEEYKCTIMENDDHTAYLIKLRPNRFPVGGHPKDHIPFTDLFFNVSDGDIVYTSSDGYLDQFGGPVGKKYNTLAFERTIFQVCRLPLSEQQSVFANNFLEWRGDHEQTDDVHVFATMLKNNF